MEQVALAALSAQIQYWPRRKGRRRASRRTTGARHRWIDRVSKYSADCKCLGARALPGGGGGVASVLLFFLLLFFCFLLLLFILPQIAFSQSGQQSDWISTGQNYFGFELGPTYSWYSGQSNFNLIDENYYHKCML